MSAEISRRRALIAGAAFATPVAVASSSIAGIQSSAGSIRSLRRSRRSLGYKPKSKALRMRKMSG